MCYWSLDSTSKGRLRSNSSAGIRSSTLLARYDSSQRPITVVASCAARGHAKPRSGEIRYDREAGGFRQLNGEPPRARMFLAG
jgi:hypothetical protein